MVISTVLSILAIAFGGPVTAIIAAAPDLLAACVAFLRCITNPKDDDDTSDVDVAVRLRAKGLLVFAVTGSAESPLAKAATRHFLAPASDELLGVVPSRSIIAQESIGNALIAALVEAVSLTRDAFQLSHPGGAIGGKK